jgi:hypothetical protein
MLVFKKALKLDPRNSVAALGLSDVLCRENMLEAACTRYVVKEYTLVPIWFPKYVICVVRQSNISDMCSPFLTSFEKNVALLLSVKDALEAKSSYQLRCRYGKVLLISTLCLCLYFITCNLIWVHRYWVSWVDTMKPFSSYILLCLLLPLQIYQRPWR